MSITVIPLKINLLTNFQEEKITFEKNLLSSSEKDVNDSLKDTDLNKYPFICLEYEYPATIFSSKRYYEVIEILFDENSLISHLSSLNPIKLNTESRADIMYKNTAINNNVLHTLRAIFPTSFPVIDDIYTSLDHIGRYKTYSYISDLTSNISHTANRIKNSYTINDGNVFSYLTNNGNDYTFTKLFFVNDILNHPIYSKILKSYNKYYNYISGQDDSYSFFDKERKNYYNSIDSINKKIDKLLQNIVLKIFKVIEDDADLLNRFDKSPLSKPIQQNIIYIFFIKHALLRIKTGRNIDFFKKLMENFFNSTLNKNNVKAPLLKLLEDYKGEIYYESSNEDFNNNYNMKADDDIDTVLGKFKLLIMEPEIDEKAKITQVTSGKKKYTIDEIYDTTISDKVNELKQQLRNSRILLSHIYRVSLYTNPSNRNTNENRQENRTNSSRKRTRQDGGNDAVPRRVNTKITADSIPYLKNDFLDELNSIFSRNKNDSEFIILFKNSFRYINKLESINVPSNELTKHFQERGIKERIDSRLTEKWNEYKNRFTEGNRITTNKFLQELLVKENISGLLPDKLKKICNKISDIFPRIKNKYISINNKLSRVDNDCDDVVGKCLDTGVSIIREFSENSTNEYAEIYIICDFINDKINDKNIKNIKCGYYDKQLGYLINNVVYKDTYSDSNYWNLIYNRNKISLNQNSESDNDGVTNENSDSFPENTNNRPIAQNNAMNSPDTNQLLTRAKTKFNNFISQSDIINKKLEVYNNTAYNPINDYNLFDNIQKYYEPLLQIILKWSNNDYYKTKEKRQNLEISLVKVKSNLESAIKVKEKEADQKLNINLTQEQLKSFQAKINLYKLFLEVLNEIEDDISKPSINQNTTNGGKGNKTKKRKQRKNKSVKKKTPNK